MVASIQYLRKSQVSLSIATVATLFSFIGSVVGSFLATRYADTYLNYLLVILVPAVALFMVFKPDFGQAKEKSRLLLFSLASITGLVIGAYDGFFGPGTGMFLTLIFTSVLGMDLLKACGTARIVNLASNAAALAMFLSHGVIDFSIAIPCAVSAVIGGFLGSRLALKIGVNVVKPVMLFVLFLLLVKVAVSLF